MNEVLPTPTPTNTRTPTPTQAPTATPTPTPIRSMTVSDITLSSSPLAGTYRRITTTVTVINESTHTPLSATTVKGTITTPSNGTASFSGNTNSSGKLTILLNSKEKGTFTATITGLTKFMYSYHPTLTTKTLLVQ